MRPFFLLPFAAVLFACAAPNAQPAEVAAAPLIMIDAPAMGPNGGPNTDEEWARVARLQRAEILAREEAGPEAKARFALMLDCARYVSSHASRKIFDDRAAGQPEDETCDLRARTASDTFTRLADEALSLNEMDRFQFFNSGYIQSAQEFKEQGAAAAQRAYLMQKVEACFAAPGLPASLSATLLTDCPIAPDGAPIAK
ncbi:MAG TPA: hypothetical protein PKV67_04695 [Hyphomonas sp.]|nr:hypothetical protein [Hyphomonas sp.]HRJ00051.1 hypothetical protein [Hyphomonas sp.]HRK66239.1 hypothetical protein [Hyphomonas sp.]